MIHVKSGHLGPCGCGRHVYTYRRDETMCGLNCDVVGGLIWLTKFPRWARGIKTGHPAHSHKRLKQVPAVNVNRIIITRCTALYLDALIDRQMVGFELWNVELDKPVI